MSPATVDAENQRASENRLPIYKAWSGFAPLGSIERKKRRHYPEATFWAFGARKRNNAGGRSDKLILRNERAQ